MKIELPDFREPPINEVVIGVRFTPIEGLTLAHYGLFWSSLRDEFTTSEEAASLGPLTDDLWSKAGGPPPRLWLIHDDEQYLIQLQSNLFFFNWRRRREAQEYPKYSTIMPLFHTYFRRYIDFLASDGLSPPEVIKCELSYINMIPIGEGDDASQSFSTLFPDLHWKETKGRYLSKPKALHWQTNFDLPNTAGELTVKVQSAVRQADNVPVLKFELNAHSIDSGLPVDEIDDWFDLAHQVIVLSFVDLTSDEAQRKLWKRINGSD